MSIFTLCLRLVVVSSGLGISLGVDSEQGVVRRSERLGERRSEIVHLVLVDLRSAFALCQVADAAGSEDSASIGAAGLRPAAAFVAAGGRALVAVVGGAAARAATIIPVLEHQIVVVLQVVLLAQTNL